MLVGAPAISASTPGTSSGWMNSSVMAPRSSSLLWPVTSSQAGLTSWKRPSGPIVPPGGRRRIEEVSEVGCHDRCFRKSVGTREARRGAGEEVRAR